MKRLCVLLVSALLSANLFADSGIDRPETAYVGVALLPFRYCEWPSPKDDVAGLRLGVVSGHHSVIGYDAALIFGYTDDALIGLASSPLNSNGELYGMQVGFVNGTGLGRGVQVGVWNMAEDFAGLQVGFANFAQRMRGVQIGIVNVISNSPIATCIILNAYF